MPESVYQQGIHQIVMIFHTWPLVPGARLTYTRLDTARLFTGGGASSSVWRHRTQ
jgi:hypothetical protein